MYIRIVRSFYCRSLSRLFRLVSSLPGRLFSSFSLVFGYGLFFLQFLDYYYAFADRPLSAAVSLLQPPPPQPHKVRLADTRFLPCSFYWANVPFAPVIQWCSSSWSVPLYSECKMLTIVEIRLTVADVHKTLVEPSLPAGCFEVL